MNINSDVLFGKSVSLTFRIYLGFSRLYDAAAVTTDRKCGYFPELHTFSAIWAVFLRLGNVVRNCQHKFRCIIWEESLTGFQNILWFQLVVRCSGGYN